METNSKTMEIYHILKKTFSEEEANKIIDYMDRLPLDRLATKEDIAYLRAEIAHTETRLIRWVVSTGVAIAGVIVAFIGVFIG